jgi:Tol biopolymer transport system component
LSKALFLVCLFLIGCFFLACVQGFSHGLREQLSRPVYMRGGERIVFSYFSGNSANIFKYDLRSGKAQQLTHAAKDVHNYSPALSPDNALIVYVSQTADASAHLFLMDSDGTFQNQLTRGISNDGSPSFSADGGTIFFARARTFRTTSTFGHTWNDWDLYSIRVKDFFETKLTSVPSYAMCCTSASPDGKSVLFAAGGPLHIYRINLETKVTELLIHRSAWDTEPTYSPDGTKIAFVSTSSSVSGSDYELYLTDSNGEMYRQVTTGHLNPASPNFSADGTKIVFLADPQDSNNYSLYEVDLSNFALGKLLIDLEQPEDKRN